MHPTYAMPPVGYMHFALNEIYSKVHRCFKAYGAEGSRNLPDRHGSILTIGPLPKDDKVNFILLNRNHELGWY